MQISLNLNLKCFTTQVPDFKKVKKFLKERIKNDQSFLIKFYEKII